MFTAGNRYPLVASTTARAMPAREGRLLHEEIPSGKESIMNIEELEHGIESSPISNRATLRKMMLYAMAGNDIHPDYADALAAASSYAEFFNAVYQNAASKNTLLWAECAKLSRRNWLSFFEPKMLIENLRMKTDGLPIQMGSGVVLAPTGSRDNIANLYVFENGGFNRNAAEFVTSIGGGFTLADYDFLGIYGIYKYRGSVILEEWDVERDPLPVSHAACGCETASRSGLRK